MVNNLEVNFLIKLANKNIDKVEKELKHWQGHSVQDMPTIFVKHRQIISCLEKFLEESIDNKQMQRINKTLFKCRNLSDRITSITGYKFPVYVDRHHLLASETARDIAPKKMEWHLHLGLYLDVFKNSKSPELKRKIAFMISNYLAKAAPIFEESSSTDLKFQRGLFQYFDYYHRNDQSFTKKFFSEDVLAKLPMKPVDFFLTDTHELQSFFPLYFTYLPAPQTESELKQQFFPWIEIMKQNIQKVVKEGQWDWNKPLEFPFLFDFTEFLKNDYHPEKLHVIEYHLDLMVKLVAEELKSQFPDAEKLQSYLKRNVGGVYRDQIKDIGIIALLNIFRAKEDRKEKDEFWEAKIKQMIWSSGTNLGFVRARELLSEFISLTELFKKEEVQEVYFSGIGPKVTYFKKRPDFLNAQLFSKCEKAFDDHEYAQVLGGSTLHLIRGLIGKIDDALWDQLNDQEESRVVLQTCLYKILTHLANAQAYRGDFARFCQEMELIHYQMADLLILTHPYKEEDFTTIYRQRIQANIPDALKQYLQVGISKSAMNTFAGINAAMNQIRPMTERTYGENCYCEEVFFIGNNRSVAEVLSNDSIPRVDLYVGEFNHNINIDPAHDLYKKGQVIQDIQAILNSKPSEYFTIAIDCTIDLVESDSVKEVLAAFAEEIKKGRLNIIFFRSGQKLDMFGMDNYYGAPFYMINNGDPKWEPLKLLISHPALQTDSLTKQWFSLVSEIDPRGVDAYRRLIFANTRKILDLVPPVLKPGNNPILKIAEVESDALAPFIDIKALGEDGPKTMEQIKALLIRTFDKHHIKYHLRPSFGFFHPNINLIGDEKGKTVMRLNPGINSHEIAAYAEFFEELRKMALVKST